MLRESESQKMEKKHLVGNIILLIGMAIVFVSVLGYREYKNKLMIIHELPKSSADLVYSIDSIEWKDEILNISGWSLQEGKAITEYNTNIVMWDSKNEKGYVREALLVKRADVTDTQSEGINYDNSGFTAYFNFKKNSINSGEYQIYIWHKGTEEDFVVKTDREVIIE